MELDSLQKDVQDVKVQVELIKKDISQFGTVVDKLDKTNDKIQDLIDNIHTIVNLHDKKLTLSERDTKDMQDEIEVLKDKISKLEKFEWAFVGIIGFLTFIMNINNILSFFTNK
jgi:septal ring factor EnvC (AmiA/AmiB activator)